MLASRIARNKDDIIEVCQTLAAQEGLKVTVTESAKSALIAGLGVFLGGLVAGPMGMAIGKVFVPLSVRFHLTLNNQIRRFCYVYSSGHELKRKVQISSGSSQRNAVRPTIEAETRYRKSS